MMNRVQYLLTKLAEECSETAQRASKAIVFGLDDVQKGQDKNNNTRLVEEFAHIVAYMELLRDENFMVMNIDYIQAEVSKKKKELEKWYQFSIDKKCVESVILTNTTESDQFKWEEPIPIKDEIRHNDVRKVLVNINMLFNYSDKIIDEVGEHGEALSYKSGFIMEPVPQKIVYTNQPSQKLYSVFTSSESN